MNKNIFYVICVLLVTLGINGCMSYNDMQLRLANGQNDIPSDAIGSFSFSNPRYNNAFQLVRGDGDTDNGLFEIRRGRELILKNGVTPTTKQYSVRIAMGASSTAGGMQKIFTFVLPVKEAPEVILVQQQVPEPSRPAAPLPPPAIGAQYTWTVNNLSSWIEAVNGVRNGGNNSTHFIFVSGTVSIPSSTENTFGAVTGIIVNIEGNGTLSPSANGSLLYIGEGQTIIAKDIVLRGRDGNSASVVYIGEGGSFSLIGNARLTGNYTDRDPSTYTPNATRTAGVYIGTNATFTLSDNATIYDNTSAASAGGVFVNGGRTTTGGNWIPAGTFIMEGGTITGNTSYSVSHSTISSPGGGVYIEGGTFNMLGGTIWGNNSWGGGGGVFLGIGNFTMQGGTISDNIAEDNTRYLSRYVYGGGVYIAGGTFIMRGGTISRNSATGGGGGVYAGRESFIMQGGTITGNTASSGGGVYVAGAFTMQGGEVSGNNADSAGGGVFLNGGNFNMQGGSISGNTAKGNGGGIFIPSDALGTFVMQGNSTVAGNTAGDKGGGVYLGSSASFTKTGGNIYGDDAAQNLKNTAASAVGHAIFENKNGGWRNATAGPTMTSDSYGFWLSEG